MKIHNSALVMAFSLSATLGVAVATPPNGFSDVDAYWGRPYVMGLSDRGAIAGFPDGTFRPDAFVTRAQFAAILVHALNLSPASAPPPFDDVSKKNWAAPAIAAVASAGYVGGFPDRTYHPDERITRAQALVILSKTLPEPKGDTERKVERYQDAARIPGWAAPAVAKAAASEIIVDFPEVAQIRPNDSATRGEIAGLVYQTMCRMGNDLPPITIGLLAPSTKPQVKVVATTPKPLPKTPAHLEIRDVQLAPHLALRAGMQLLVTVHGTPGNIGIFSIGGIAAAQDLALREMQPGVYSGAYRVGASDARLNCIVSATLHHGDEVVTKKAEEVANFDALPPQITNMQPPPNSMLGNRRVAVGANFRSAVSLENVYLTINGQDVTPMCAITPNSIRYNHPIPFRSKTLTMHLKIVDQAGNNQAVSWTTTFTSPPPGYKPYHGQYYRPPNPAQQQKRALENDLIRVINAL